MFKVQSFCLGSPSPLLNKEERERYRGWDEVLGVERNKKKKKKKLQ